jgi:hypothetical protein
LYHIAITLPKVIDYTKYPTRDASEKEIASQLKAEGTELVRSHIITSNVSVLILHLGAVDRVDEDPNTVLRKGV